jgi:hypothetical protein
MGTLKLGNGDEQKKHMWVMSISDNLEEINFYDPFLKKQILHIKGKIKNKSILQWYLLATKMNFDSIKYKLEKMESNFCLSLKTDSLNKNSHKLKENADEYMNNKQDDKKKNKNKSVMKQNTLLDEDDDLHESKNKFK